jgi:hypothetical protein
VYRVVSLLNELPQSVIWQKAALLEAIAERLQVPQRRQELLAYLGGLFNRDLAEIHAEKLPDEL